MRRQVETANQDPLGVAQEVLDVLAATQKYDIVLLSRNVRNFILQLQTHQHDYTALG